MGNEAAASLEREMKEAYIILSRFNSTFGGMAFQWDILRSERIEREGLIVRIGGTPSFPIGLPFVSDPLSLALHFLVIMSVPDDLHDVTHTVRDPKTNGVYRVLFVADGYDEPVAPNDLVRNEGADDSFPDVATHVATYFRVVDRHDRDPQDKPRRIRVTEPTGARATFFGDVLRKLWNPETRTTYYWDGGKRYLGSRTKEAN